LWRVEIATNRVLGLACVVAGLPAGVEDGDQLRWAVVGAPVEPASARRAPGEDVGASHAIAAGARLSLNEASLAELESLPGVGPVLAGRIVAARPFRTVDELDRVRGIGPKSLARLAPLVRP
jgi:competence protein ComEA